ncbi:MAG: thioredoxin domain-containing protein [Polyangiaceae bacterium]
MHARVLPLIAVVAAGCSAGPAPTTASAPVASVAPVASLEITHTDEAHWSTAIAAGDPVPVTEADPLWGSPDAPVTIVLFADATNIACAREELKLQVLRDTYGPEKLRIAWKHYPGSTDGAKHGAALGAALFDVGGGPAFFAFTKKMFATRLADPKGDLSEALLASAEAAKAEVSFKPSELAERMEAAGPKLEEDAALAKALQVRTAPTYFIDGIRLTGSVQPEVWKRLVDTELAATKDAYERGDRSTLYAERLGLNTRAGYGLPSAEARTRNPPDETIYAAAIGGSPARGNAEARVTLVEFGDFEENYSRSVQDELSHLRTFYGDKLRLVFKFAPQPRHERGALAAELAAFIYDKKGADAFWVAHDALYSASAALEDATLERIAKEAGLEPKSTLAEIKAHKHANLLDADRDLADDLKVTSLPQIFINGKRVKGVQQEGYFASMIDAEIAFADQRLASGARPADLYAAIMKDAVPMRAFQAKAAPTVTGDNPARGPSTAPVTIQVFCEYPSPYCKKVFSTLGELDAAFPKQLRFVWRHFPIQGEPTALPSAIAGAEVKRQKGDATFWKFTDAIFASTDKDALSRAGLDKLAAKFGVDAKTFDAALDATDPPGVVTDDLKRAAELGVNAAPTTFVGDFMLVGALPIETFKHAVRAALAAKP